MTAINPSDNQAATNRNEIQGNTEERKLLRELVEWKNHFIKTSLGNQSEKLLSIMDRAKALLDKWSNHD